MSNLGLQIKQSQNMVMTSQMQQSIKILQMTTTDLLPYINQQIEENPFLEAGDGDVVEQTDSSELTNNEPSEVSEHEQVWDDDDVSPAVYESESFNYEGVGSGKSDAYASGENPIEQLEGDGITLKEHVIDQINMEIPDPLQKFIALNLTDMLDENGYINSDLSENAKLLQCDEQQLLEVLSKLQSFEPAGIFARSLAECLSLQLKEKDRLDPTMQIFIENLELLGKRDFKLLKKKCRVDDEDLAQMCLEVKALNPKPGNIFSVDRIQVIQPDIFLKKGEGSGWLLELNSDALPKVLVSRKYYSTITKQVDDKDSKKFMSQQFNTANWLSKALDQRANTILKVATEIVSQQDKFFRKGIHYLKPMVLSDIAQGIDMHESTVSRVINGKYIATNSGMYELKYFFSSCVGSSSGEEDVSSKRIKYMIKELIDGENSKAVLSDDKIASILKAKGVSVARRTVMKYREGMNIGSSVQRRREKKML